MAQDARGDRDDQNEGLLEEEPEEILSGYDKQVNMFGHARKLYEAARDGDHMTLFTILADLPVPLRKNMLETKFKDEEGQVCPPLVIAARNGHLKCVKKILVLAMVDENTIDLEIRGDVIFRGTLIEGATALWSAACAGYVDVVEELIKAGADPNTKSLGTSRSPALRVACLEGHSGVVKWMIENSRADVNGANMYDNTCLMSAAYRGHMDVINHLLRNGALVDMKSKCGTAALHLAADQGNVAVVRCLATTGGANIELVTNHGLTPAMVAANSAQHQVVEYLLDLIKSKTSTDSEQPTSYCQKEEEIQTLELLGASLAVSTQEPRLDLAFTYLERAMQLRYSDPVVLKPAKTWQTHPLREVYNSHVESSSIEDLESLRPSAEAGGGEVGEGLNLVWEALVVRERILGIPNIELAHPIWVTGARFADRGDYRKCVQLWVHALKLKSLTDKRLDDYLQRFCEMLATLLLRQSTVQHQSAVKFEDYMFLLNTALDGMRAMKLHVINKPELIKYSVTAERTRLMYLDLCSRGDPMRTTMKVFLNVLSVFAKNSGNYNKRNSIFTQDQRQQVHQLVELAVKQVAPRTILESGSLIHAAVDTRTSLDGESTLRYPCPYTLRLLIEAGGGDPSSADVNLDTPIHLIVSYKKVVSNFQSLLACAKILIQAGAHCDIMNKDGLTAYGKCATGVAHTILRSTDKMRINLKCLSARAIKRHKLAYKGAHVLPRDLEKFVDIHAP